MRKGTGGEDGYSGFTVRHVRTGRQSPTDLDEILRSHAVTRVVVVGLAQDVCVQDTALDARPRGYDTTVAGRDPAGQPPPRRQPDGHRNHDRGRSHGPLTVEPNRMLTAIRASSACDGRP